MQQQTLNHKSIQELLDLLKTAFQKEDVDDLIMISNYVSYRMMVPMSGSDQISDQLLFSGTQLGFKLFLLGYLDSIDDLSYQPTVTPNTQHYWDLFTFQNMMQLVTQYVTSQTMFKKQGQAGQVKTWLNDRSDLSAFLGLHSQTIGQHQMHHFEALTNYYRMQYQVFQALFTDQLTAPSVYQYMVFRLWCISNAHPDWLNLQQPNHNQIILDQLLTFQQHRF